MILASDLEVMRLFSASGQEARLAYTGTAPNKRVEYMGMSPINSPTSAERWYISKVEYDGDGCPIRIRNLSVQRAWDDRATLFP